MLSSVQAALPGTPLPFNFNAIHTRSARLTRAVRFVQLNRYMTSRRGGGGTTEAPKNSCDARSINLLSNVYAYCDGDSCPDVALGDPPPCMVQVHGRGGGGGGLRRRSRAAGEFRPLRVRCVL